MNRRQFLIGCTTSALILPMSGAAGQTEVEQASILRMFRVIPDRAGLAGLDFPITSAFDYSIQREVWLENPELYQAQKTEDLSILFGFSSAALDFRVHQDVVEVWELAQDLYSTESTLELLRYHGWEMTNRDLSILRFAGDSDERSYLADSMNVFGDMILDGAWDWIAAPTERLLVLGSDDEVVRSIAENVTRFEPVAKTESRFPGLLEIVRHDTYAIRLLPFQSLPLEGVSAVFLSKSWSGDVPVINSIGMHLGSSDAIEVMIAEFEARFHTRQSTTTNRSYAEFLEVSEIVQRENTLRIDLVVTEEEWDIFRAFEVNDLGMLPIA